jgi:cobalt-zinc-cadmium efflux system protein
MEQCDHDHSSEHSHGHGHVHLPATFGKAFAIGIVLNTAFVAAEVIFGLKANSLALLADAGHNASDVLGLFLAAGAFMLSRRKASDRFTYGLQSSTIIAALANAMLLLLVVGGIGWEALQRLARPEAAAGYIVMAVAAAGVAVNGFTAWLFMAGRKTDLNVRGAYLHMAADAVISLGVVISGFLMLQTGWLWLDPLVSLVISLAIILSTFALLKDSLGLALHAVPESVDLPAVRTYLAGLDGVKEVHDLHIWAMSTTETALSAHLLIPGGHPGDQFIIEIVEKLDHDFHIGHATIQIEVGQSSEGCKLASAHAA